MCVSRALSGRVGRPFLVVIVRSAGGVRAYLGGVGFGGGQPFLGWVRGGGCLWWAGLSCVQCRRSPLLYPPPFVSSRCSVPPAPGLGSHPSAALRATSCLAPPPLVRGLRFACLRAVLLTLRSVLLRVPVAHRHCHARCDFALLSPTARPTLPVASGLRF